METRKIIFIIKKEKHRKFKTVCCQNDETMSSVINKLLDNYIEDGENKVEVKNEFGE